MIRTETGLSIALMPAICLLASLSAGVDSRVSGPELRDVARNDGLQAAVVPEETDSEPAAGTDTVCTVSNGDPSAECSEVLREVQGRLPERLTGLRQSEASIRSLQGMRGIVAEYGGATTAQEEMLVFISYGDEARAFVEEQVVSEIESEGTVERTTVGGAEAFTGRSEEDGEVAVGGYPGGFALVVVVDDAARGPTRGSAQRLERAREGFVRLQAVVLGDATSNAQEGHGEEAREEGRRRVAWRELSVSFVPPAGWAVQDLGELTGGMLPGVVLMRDREVAERRYGPDWGASTEDTFAIGSAGNVSVSLSPTPVDPSRTEPASFLDGMEGHVGELLPDGEAVGEVGQRAVGDDSLPALPFRGHDRDGTAVRGWLLAVPVDGALLHGQVMAGPEAPAAAVDSALRMLGTVRRGGSDR